MLSKPACLLNEIHGMESESPKWKVFGFLTYSPKNRARGSGGPDSRGRWPAFYSGGGIRGMVRRNEDLPEITVRFFPD